VVQRREQAHVSATPGASSEYSRGPEGSSGSFRAAAGPAWRDTRRRSLAIDRGPGKVIFGLVLLAALALVAAEFTTLYEAHIATKTAPIQSVTAGSHNSYAMIPIAVLAALFGVVVWRSGSRLALLGIGVLGVVALVVALLHDLPDAHVVGLANHNSVEATTTPKAGLYMETLGAILLIATSGLAFLIAGLPRARARAHE
jgi:hypothetical protein